MSNAEALHNHLMEMVDNDEHLITHGSVRFNLFEHAFSLSVAALRESKNDKELIAKQAEKLQILRSAAYELVGKSDILWIQSKLSESIAVLIKAVEKTKDYA